MRKIFVVLLCAVAISLLPERGAFAQLSNYIFSPGMGTSIPLSAPTVFVQGKPNTNIRNQFPPYTNGKAMPAEDIGFTFNFGGVNYTKFSLSSNGLMSLGASTVTDSYNNYLTGSPTYPILAPFWDMLSLGGGNGGARGEGNTPWGSPAISYGVEGISPNRILVVEWKDLDVQGRPGWADPYATFQVRLYEGTNKIEFYYDRMSACGIHNAYCYNTSTTIGIAASSSSFMSVTPDGSSASMSTSSTNDYFDLYNVPIPSGTLYTFQPCTVVLTGRTGDGGTPNLLPGDTLLGDVSVLTGNSGVYKPLEAKMTAAACSGSYTMTISGPAAADYYFGTPGTQTVTTSLDAGYIDIPAITFMPTIAGARPAILTVTDGGTFTRTFNLGARAPLINYTGDLAQGGTSGMKSGDTLLKGQRVPRYGSQVFTPFTLTNVSGASQTIDYTLNDPSGQYAISGDVTIANGAATTPQITFNPTGFGPQPATLKVAHGSETNTFILYATSAAPGGILLNGVTSVAISDSRQFLNQYSCSGEVPVSQAISVQNLGFGDFSITGMEFYALDTTVDQQNAPLLRDGQGGLIPLSDYILTAEPLSGPVSASSVLSYPIRVSEGSTQTIYLTFLSSQPGRRYAKGFIMTNGENFSGVDTSGSAAEGVVNLNVYGRGSSSLLSGDPTRQVLPKVMVFPVTKVGQSSTMRVVLANPGSCELRVSMKSLAISSGDVKEFTIVARPTTNLDPVTGDLLIASNSADSSIEVSYTPLQSGSRRSVLLLRTNDSSLYMPGISNRGEYHLDLVGTTPATLAITNIELGGSLAFGDALIGGGESEQKHQSIALENTTNDPVEITAIQIEGVDAGEFAEDGVDGWPDVPYTMQPGERLELKLAFAPVGGGESGERNATLSLVLNDGDQVSAQLSGYAGTRVLTVTPMVLTFPVLTHGKQSRQTVRISNTGTIAMTITVPELSQASDFTVSGLARLVLAPGQSELVEVTYSPTVVGTSSGTLTITSNAALPDGVATVILNGSSSKAHELGGGAEGQSTQSGHGQSGGEGLGGQRISGVMGEVVSGGVSLSRSVPNPGRDRVEIRYELAERGMVELGLYDGSGRLVRELASGVREAGEQRVVVDVSELASGVYHYRLQWQGEMLTQSLTVVH